MLLLELHHARQAEQLIAYLQRAPKGSLVDAVEPQIRALLEEFPRMLATVIAERIGWTSSVGPCRWPSPGTILRARPARRGRLSTLQREAAAQVAALIYGA
jgi:hypothetical protein